MSASINLDKPVRLDIDELSAADYEDFESVTGMDLLEFATAMQEGRINERNFLKNLKPLTAFLWVCWRKDHEGLTHEDVRHMGLGKLLKGIEIVQVPVEGSTAPAREISPAASIRN